MRRSPEAVYEPCVSRQRERAGLAVGGASPLAEVLVIDAAARTHAGRVRANNEDAFVCLPERGLFAAIDGMGGEAAGEIAAAITARTLAEVPDSLATASETLLVTAVKTARQRILEEGTRNPAHRELGAVATAVRLDDDGRHLCVAHVGDTRAWLVGRAGPTRLTRDHLAEGAGKRPVARDLGRHDLEGDWVDTRRVGCAEGDLLLLCSDGLTDVVADEELGPMLARFREEGANADTVSARLVGLALSRGAPDNVTVVVAKISRFRRGETAKARSGWRLGVLTVLGAGLGIAAAAWWFRPAAEDLSAILDGSGVQSTVRAVALPPDATLVVRDGAVWTLGGARVRGASWTVEVGAGASLTLDLVAVDVTESVSLRLGEGARVLLYDSHIAAPNLSITGPGSASVELRGSGLSVGRVDGFDSAVPLHLDTESRVPLSPTPLPADSPIEPGVPGASAPVARDDAPPHAPPTPPRNPP